MLGFPIFEMKENHRLGIGKRTFSDNSVNKAKQIDPAKLEKLNERQQLVIQLQDEFGLRREESLKFKPSYADNGDSIQLKASWCKGGRAREIPILTTSQRELIDRCLETVKSGSMIPKNESYIEARVKLDNCCRNAAMLNNHGFRHQYAQDRYKTLTSGLNCPKNGGLTSRELSVEEKARDNAARMILTEELGHGREQITVNYLGR